MDLLVIGGMIAALVGFLYWVNETESGTRAFGYILGWLIVAWIAWSLYERGLKPFLR